MRQTTLTALPDFPLVAAGTDLAELLAGELVRHGLIPEDGDILVLAQKIVSKAEGRFVDLAEVTPSPGAVKVAGEAGKDPRLVEAILSESRRVVRVRKDLIIVEHRLGFVMANAGVDQSNVGTRPDIALLLPEDPDASADALRQALGNRFGVQLGVIINDSFGRAWRKGVCGVAIGAAGLPCLIDKRGDVDLFGRELKVTVIGFADEVAAAASLVMGQADEGCPVVLVRGLSWQPQEGRATDLVRAAAEDLFR
ncbi:coenzyme F420-0:L-glutamate ligase [Bosea sp. BK604]|uniref:coenzyme F420-0:L-glutamate ligase n=1 Tax=Bosea sp. BK604 TaxID=2512180 RepID=UPI0010491E05|nr:coenzyme F420-0:L-glutamate ligase [Bosea sp. BK604]TCR65636.1 coenzyme F420-0 gamma-glutamyl ligase [Bosea sp. BK604]